MRIWPDAEGPDRTAAIAAWLQGLYPKPEEVPVLVGGGAVELYTRGAYRTGDLDFVGRVPDVVAGELERAGFRRTGRHWVHEEERVFLEFPAASFDTRVRLVNVRFGDRTVRILSPEDVLVDRLAAWKHWKAVSDGVNAYLLWRDRAGEMDAEYLASAAAREDVADALEDLRSLGHVEIEEGERWARSIR